MAASRWFHWVVVDRDETPEIPKRFNVSAYPSMLVLGRDDENVHRWTSFKKPVDFIPDLREAKRRWALHDAGEVWHTKYPRPATLTAEAEVTQLAPLAESAEVPSGACWHDGALRVGLRRKLHTLVGREWVSGFDLPPHTIDLASDGTHIYALEGGWTAGKPIHVLDFGSGATVRTIVTQENTKNRAHGAKGIAWRDGYLWVLEGMRGTLKRVDPETGEVRATLQTELKWVSGLDWTGTEFVTTGRNAIHWLDPSGLVTGTLPVNYRLRLVTAVGDGDGDGDGGVVVFEQPVRGFDADHQRIWVWPERTVPYRVVR